MKRPLNLPMGLPARQRGAVAVIVALSLVGMIGFVGLALDLGKLFVAKSELQNSADACALAAARELTGANANQLMLAKAAGKAIGEQHKVLFQGESIEVKSVQFSDTLTGSYQDAFTGAGATDLRFARCEVERTGIANWFIQVLNIGNQDVRASAVATLRPGQSACAIPIGVCESELAGKNKGDWLFTLLDPGNGLTGSFMWLRLNGQGAKGLKDVLTASNNLCEVKSGTEVESETGSIVGAYDAWNTRFGLYKGNYSVADAAPDITGFAYIAKSWNQCEKAFDDFKVQRSNYSPYQDVKNKTDRTGLRLPIDPSPRDIHKTKGKDRRLVTVPIVDCNQLQTSKKSTVKSWACVLMLHPLDNQEPEQSCPGQPGKRAAIEYLGSASDLNSPCASFGAVGGLGAAGALVPALVR